jgi:seryl-tRNA synthetase
MPNFLDIDMSHVFLQEGGNCGYVKFVDMEWSGALKKALLKLWSLLEECKHEKKQIEKQLRQALEEKDKAVNAMMQIELQTADIISEYKDKTDEAKSKLKKCRKNSMKNDSLVLYAVCVIVFLVGLLLGVCSSK